MFIGLTTALTYFRHLYRGDQGSENGLPEPPLLPLYDTEFNSTFFAFDGDGDDGDTGGSDGGKCPLAITFNGGAHITSTQKLGKANVLEFDGVDDYLSIPNSTRFDFTGDFTVECWVKLRSYDGASTIGSALVSRWNPFTSAADNRWLLKVESGTHLPGFYANIGGDDDVAIVAGQKPLKLGRWYHLAAVREGTTWRLFQNGKRVGEVSEATAIATGTIAVELGRQGSGGGDAYLDGFLAGVRISTVARYSTKFSPRRTALPSLSYGVVGEDANFSSNVLLLPFDGADAATVTTDESCSNHQLTFANNAQLDTTEKKFGTASIKFDGVNDYVSIPDSADWILGTGQFTIEFWFKFSSYAGAGTPLFIGQFGQAGGTQVWAIVGPEVGAEDKCLFFFHDGALAILTGTRAAGNFAFGTWYHVAVDRDVSNVIRIYFDGVVSGSVTDAANIRDLNQPFHIGQRDGAASGNENLDGWMDGVRIKKGIALYGGAFTPSTEPHPLY